MFLPVSTNLFTDTSFKIKTVFEFHASGNVLLGYVASKLDCGIWHSPVGEEFSAYVRDRHYEEFV
jgi:hypothetical protein